MKILKIFGVVVGIHVFFIIGAFVIPGCSSASKPTPKPDDTIAATEPPPSITIPTSAPESAAPLMSPAPITFGPEPAITMSSSSSGTRFSPTRPDSAAASTLARAPVSNVTPATPYTVKPNDNLWTIAKKNNLTVAELAAANNLKTSAVLQPGQRMIIPGKPVPVEGSALSAPSTTGSGKAPAAKAAPAATNEVRHTVKFGESLSKIAQQYGVTVRELGTRNNISDPGKLVAGAVLIIPGWQATGAGNGKSSAKKSDPVAAPPAVSSPPVEMNPLFNPGSLPPPVVTPAPANEVPVIKVDELPPSSAPKSN